MAAGSVLRKSKTETVPRATEKAAQSRTEDLERGPLPNPENKSRGSEVAFGAFVAAD